MGRKKRQAETTKPELSDDSTILWKNYRNLARTIVYQACFDHRKAMAKIRRHRRRYGDSHDDNAISTAEYTVKEVEQFLRSDWFRFLSPNVCADYLMKKLREAEEMDSRREEKKSDDKR